MSDLPTPQAIENLRKRINAAWPLLIAANPPHSPHMARVHYEQWDADLRVLTYAEECRAAQVEGEEGPGVATPEDAGGDDQPPTDPAARVRAMSDEEVEAELTGRGVLGWARHHKSPRHRRGWAATGSSDPSIDYDGVCTRPYSATPVAPHEFDYDDIKGDTTTPEGRAECSRRLLVHLLREEGVNG